MISKSLSTSRKYAALAVEAGTLAEFCQALFPLIVAHADDFGRLPGDVFTIRHLVWPTSPRSLEQFNAALTALDHVGLILRYRVDGGDYLQVLQFEEHQTGLSKRTSSKFPEPSGTSRKFQESPEQLNRTKQNLTELNLREGELESARPPAPPAARTAALTTGLKEHRNHACCGVVCLHASQFDDFVRRSRQQPDPDGYVRAFFRGWDGRYAEGDRKSEPIGGDAFDFWRSRWKETHPEAKPVLAAGESAAEIIARRRAQV